MHKHMHEMDHLHNLTSSNILEIHFYRLNRYAMYVEIPDSFTLIIEYIEILEKKKR